MISITFFAIVYIKRIFVLLP